VVDVQISDLWPVLAVIIIPLLIYFVRLEVRVRRVEDLEGRLTLEARIQKLEADPVFTALKQLSVQDAIALYTSASAQGDHQNEPK
jgi:hypothetical protein